MDATSRRSLHGPNTGRRPDRGPGRITGLLLGLVLALLSLGFLGGGAYAAWAGTSGTYIDLGAHGSFRTDRYGLATESTDWRSTLFGWAGDVRLEVAPKNQKPIFVGVAEPGTIDHYLSGAGYTTISESSDSERTDHGGRAPAVPAAKAVAWTAHAEGTGTQTLHWRATDGRRVVFAMNADGSRAVDVKIVSSAVTVDRMPWWVPAGLLIIGIILLPAGAFTIRRSFRTR